MIDQVKEKICEVKDFPTPGVGFKDITPFVQDPKCYNYVIDEMVSWAQKKNPQIVVGIESRGFLFAAPVAHRLRSGVAIIRKRGKLPRDTLCLKAPNEYATEYFEMHKDSISKFQRVLIVDDLIATGSSSISAIDIVKKLGGQVVGFETVIELTFLKGKENIKKSHPDAEVHSLIEFSE
ncbi:adenine phosphoribosyltransferase [bacterium]|nr:adenine phosphoribosyltransferase [bacterium]